MKKMKNFMAALCATVALAGCGLTGNTGDNLFGNLLNGGTVGNMLTSVLGLDKVSASQLVGTWIYSQPGVAFTSDNFLAQAGGEVAASQIKSQLQNAYSTLNVKSSNTQFTFNQDGTLSGKMLGFPLQGTYTYDASSGAIVLKTLLSTYNAYIKGTGSGISLLFEGTKLLNLIQGLGSLSGNSSLSLIGNLSSNFNGLRIGFDLVR